MAAIPAGATIIAYNAPFEKGVLRELAAIFPDLKAALLDMAERTVDPLPVTRNHWYHRDQRGSWSIKAVLQRHIRYLTLHLLRNSVPCSARPASTKTSNLLSRP